MKTTMLSGLAAVAFALVMVLPAVSMAGEGEWRSYEYEFQELGPATSSPQTGFEEMAPAVPGKEEMSPEEMTPSASEPQKELEEMAPAGSASRHEEYVYPKNAPYREPPVESQPY